MKKALIVASVGAMIEDFNSSNIEILQELGYEVHIAANFNPNNDKQLKKSRLFLENMKKNGVTSYQLDFQRGIGTISSNVKVYKQLLNIMRQNNYKIVHCHSPIGGVLTRLAGKKIKQSNIIYTAHGFHFYKGAPLKNWLLFYPIEKYLSKFTDIIITINKEDYELAEKRFYKSKIEYIPGIGVDTYKIKHFKPTESISSKIALKKSSFIILSVGELNSNKNHELVIRSLSMLKNRDFLYLIAGEGPLKEELITLSKKYGIRDKVILLGYRTDIISIMKQSDLFVFPSKREGLPVSVMEAISSEIPVLVSNIRGNKDLVPYKSMRFELDNPKELAEKIKKTMNSKSDFQKIDASCYDFREINRRMLEIYEKLLMENY